MALSLVKALPALVFKIDNFVRAVLEEHFGADAGTLDLRVADTQVAAVPVEEHIVEAHGGAFGDVEFFNVDFVAFGDAVLFPAGFDDCESHKPDSENKSSRRWPEILTGWAGKGVFSATPLFRPQVVFSYSSSPVRGSQGKVAEAEQPVVGVFNVKGVVGPVAVKAALCAPEGVHKVQ